jgi:hypothetical protein
MKLALDGMPPSEPCRPAVPARGRTPSGPIAPNGSTSCRPNSLSCGSYLSNPAQKS